MAFLRQKQPAASGSHSAIGGGGGFYSLGSVYSPVPSGSKRYPFPQMLRR